VNAGLVCLRVHDGFQASGPQVSADAVYDWQSEQVPS
ncbi:uncharacterized protein METZ01_LOCUS395473, partial [marine metagenome]